MSRVPFCKYRNDIKNIFFIFSIDKRNFPHYPLFLKQFHQVWIIINLGIILEKLFKI